MKPARPQRGYILVSVVVTLTLLAALAFLASRDAGMNLSAAARGFQADSARYVAEAGLAQANYRAQNADCVNYPALSNVVFGAGQFNASATPTSGTPVTLSAIATLPGGATATLTRANVAVYRTTPRTVTLQPATVLKDTFIKTNPAHKNQGAGTALKVEGTKARILLHFDLSSVPSSAWVQSAQLMLYKKSGGAGPGGSTITAYPLTRTWVEGTLDDGSPADGATWDTSNGTTAWTTPGGDYDASTGAVTASTASSNIWVSWDVTPFVSNWASGTAANHGMILIPSSSVPSQSYVSGNDDSERSETPKLIVTFRARCDWTAPPPSTTLNPSADSYINQNTLLTNYGASTSITLADQNHIDGLFRFDTSTVAPGTLLANAKLRLYVTSLDMRSGNTLNLEVRQVTSAWTELFVNWIARALLTNWSNSGGDYSSSNAATLALPSSFNGGWIEFDLTTLAQGWVDGVVPNNGVIVLEKAADRLFVASREAGAATAPQLVLTY